MRSSKNSARRLIAVGVSAFALTFTTPVVSAQLPGGMSMEDARAAVAAPISVPAGETVTVDVGVPVSASYSGSGWSVSSAGTSVTVTAPAEPGAQASVPASALGQSTTITLIATGEAAAPALPESNPAAPPAPTGPDTVPGAGDAPAPDSAGGSGSGSGSDNDRGEEGSGQGQSTEQDSAPGNESAPASQSTPDREQASEVDGTNAEYLDLAATVEGHSIVASLGLSQAVSLYKQFSDLDEDSVSLRYLDVDGQIIEGVQRDIDVASRTLTLTYPEGQTPDNPFILQVVRGDESVLVVRLIDESRQLAQPGKNSQAPEEFARQAETDTASTGAGFPALWLSLGIIAVVAAVAAVAVIRRRRRRP